MKMLLLGIVTWNSHGENTTDRHVTLVLPPFLVTTVAVLFSVVSCTTFPKGQPELLVTSTRDDRSVHLTALEKIARPVLLHTSQCTLHQDNILLLIIIIMINQTETHLPDGINCTSYQVSAAFGRMLAGIVPWLELGEDVTTEGQLRAEYLNMAMKAFHNVFLNSACGDYVHWNECASVLVEAAYIGYMMLRMPLVKQPMPQQLLEAIRGSMLVAVSIENTVPNNHVNCPAISTVWPLEA